MGKKTNIPDYLKKKIKGTTISGGASIGDDEWTTTPKGSIGFGKGDKKANITVSKPFSKFDKENINSTIKAEFTKEGKDSSLTIGGSKTGKAKDAFVTFSKTFKKGSKKAVRPKRGGGPDWINTHEPGPQGNPAVIKKIKNSREFHIANPGIEDVADYSLIYGKPIKLTTKKNKKKKK